MLKTSGRAPTLVWSFLLFLLGALGVPSPAGAHPDLGQATWEKVSEGDNITVYRWDVPESPIRAFRAVAEIDSPVAKVVQAISDVSRQKEWMPNLKEARVLKQISPLERVQYTHVGTPFVIKDRDFVIHGKASYEAKTRVIKLSFASMEKGEVPGVESPETHFVRGRILESSYTLSQAENGHTRVEFIVHVDPMGSVPKWIVNMFQSSFPRKTLSALTQQAAKSDVIEHPLVKKLFDEKDPEKAKAFADEIARQN